MVVALKYWRLRRAASRLPGPLKLASAAHRNLSRFACLGFEPTTN